MKIKNMKLMLLGLLATVGMNAYAQHTTSDKIIVDGYDYYYTSDALDEKGRSVDNIVYDLRTVTWKNYNSKTTTTKEATVIGVNASASNADVATIVIPAEVAGDKGTYEVTWINNSTWASAQKAVEGVTTSLSLDLTNVWPGSFSDVAFKNFTKLTSLTIKEASTTQTPNAAVFDGSECKFKTTLTTLNLKESRINEIAESGLAGYTALTSFDFGTNITKVGAKAFQGDYGVSTLTIPATVIAIGEDAFSDMYYKKDANTAAVGLTTLTINGANNTYTGATLTASEIPAAFKGNAKLNSVTVGSTTATKIAENAFAASATNAAAPITAIDLSGATALATTTNAFPTGLALQSVKLYGSNMATLAQTDLDLSASQLSLTEITLPKKLNTLSQLFTNFLYLKELDLSVTDVKAIPEDLFYISPRSLQGIRHKKDPSAQFKDADGYAYSSKNMNYNTAIWIDPALELVKLNAGTTTIGRWAFCNCEKLATVANLDKLTKLQSIGWYAFNNTALTTVDLSASTGDDNSITSIPQFAFGNIATLTSITLPTQINSISTGAFAYDKNVTSINLQDLATLTTLNPIFHGGPVGQVVENTYTFYAYDEDGDQIFDKYGNPVVVDQYTYLGTNGIPEVAIALSNVTLPPALRRIEDGALQLLDIAEITIPSTVTYVGQYALQGCIKLENFTWNDAKGRTIYDNAFRGDDHLKDVKMITKASGSSITIATTGYSIEDESVDVIFKGNKKDELTFTVNAEDYASFLANGWSETNLHYCTLSCVGASTYKFVDAGKSGEYYYATYYNSNQATWFPEENFEVFSAVVDGPNVVMKPATVEEGYYKVKKSEPCIIRSKVQEVEYDLKNASFNNISTMPTDNDLRWTTGTTPSRLSYQYKLGNKGGVVAFYRITSGTIKGVYISAQTPYDRMNVVFDGGATAIKGIENAAENKGAIYNLQGVRVNKAQKGLYIQNGKKFIMK